MAAIDEEAASLDRGEFAADFGDPVFIWQLGHNEGFGTIHGRQESETGRIRRRLKVCTDLPRSCAVFDLKGPDARRLWIHAFESFGKRFGGRLAGQRGQGGEGGHAYSAGAGLNRLKMVSCPGSGWRGIKSASRKEQVAIPAARKNTAPGEISQRYPKPAGRKTAAM